MLPASIIQVPFLSYLDRTQRQRLVSLAQTIVVPEGACLFRRGDSGGDLYVIERGTLAVIDGRSSPETILEVLGPGGAVGEMSFCDLETRTADVRARGETVCLHWSHDSLESALAMDLPLATSFYRALASMAVARTRTITTTAIVGGLASRPAGEGVREDAQTSEEIAALLHGVRVAWQAAEREGTPDQEARDGLDAALRRLARWLARIPDADRAVWAGAVLLADLRPLLAQSATGEHLLARAAGTPSSSELLSHLHHGAPRGQGPAGTRLDAGLLALPTIRGLRWRQARALEAIAESLPGDRPARVLAVQCGATGLLAGLLPILAERGARLVCIEGSEIALADAQPQIHGARASVEIEVALEDLVQVGMGRSASFWMNQDLVVVDGLGDVLPDRLLAGLSAWGLAQLAPGGLLVSTHAAPGDDAALLAELLNWPLVHRRPRALAGLLSGHGRFAPEVRESGDEAIAGTVALTRRGLQG